MRWHTLVHTLGAELPAAIYKDKET